MEISGILLKISKWDRKALWDSWQRNAGSHKRVGKLEAFIRGYQVQVWDLYRPQEFGILYESTEVEQKTSALSLVSVKIWLHSKICTGNKNGKGRWTK